MYSVYQGCPFSSSCSSLFAVCDVCWIVDLRTPDGLVLPKLSRSSFDRTLLLLFFRVCGVFMSLFSRKPDVATPQPLSTQLSHRRRDCGVISLQDLAASLLPRKNKTSVRVAGGFESICGYGCFICVVMSLQPVPFFVGKQCGWLLRKLWCFRTSKSNPHDQRIARTKHEDTIHSQCSVLSCFGQSSLYRDAD